MELGHEDGEFLLSGSFNSISYTCFGLRAGKTQNCWGIANLPYERRGKFFEMNTYQAMKKPQFRAILKSQKQENWI
jgi:hypothetical protein